MFNLTVEQLPVSPPTFVILRCSACGAEYSATRGDYFLDEPGTEMRCECEMPLAIVTRKTVYNHEQGQRWLDN